MLGSKAVENKSALNPGPAGAFSPPFASGLLLLGILAFTMAASSSNLVFDDIFTIGGIDKEGKKFDRGASRAREPNAHGSLRRASLAPIRALQKLRHGYDA
jgi:hypothetical protein